MRKHFILAAVVATQSFTTALADSGHAALETGISYDTNAYRAPSSDYTDFFADPTGNTVVSPDEQSGFFIPVEFKAGFSMPLSSDLLLIGDYSYSGRTYLDSELDNADEDVHMLSLGTEYTFFNTSSSRSKINTTLLYNDHDRVYYDRDSGEKKSSGSAQEDVSDRYTYDTTGGVIEYEYWKKKDYRLKVKLRSEDRDHDTTPTGFEYDHRYSRFDIDYSNNITRDDKLYLQYAYYIRDYDERRARNESGQLFSRHSLLEYTYHDIAVKYKQELSKNFDIKYGVSFTTREDDFEGYNDYDLFELSLSSNYKFTHRLSLKSKLVYWDQDYPNAWNFDRDPSRFSAITDTSNKSADGARFEAKLKYRFDRNRFGYLDIKYRDNNNSDERYDYDRAIIMLGIDWGFNFK